MKTILVSKEILCKQHIGFYDGRIKTPNIDNLFHGGSHADNYIASAPLTAMAFPSMFTGRYAFDLSRRSTKDIETTFDALANDGKKSVAILGHVYKGYLAQPTTEYLTRNLDIKYVENCEYRSHTGIAPFKKLVMENEAVDFMWIHFQHYFYPEACLKEGLYTEEELSQYGDQGLLSRTMLAIDKFIGWLRAEYHDARIILTSDHGEAQGENGHFWYTNHFDEAIVCIPLVDIGIEYVRGQFDNILSSRNLHNIILNREIYVDKYTISENRYFSQRDRKLMVRTGNYKYIYHAETQKEKLYHLPLNEHVDLLNCGETYYDRYKKHLFEMKTLLNYDRWDEIPELMINMRNIKNLWDANRVDELSEVLHG